MNYYLVKATDGVDGNGMECKRPDVAAAFRVIRPYRSGDDAFVIATRDRLPDGEYVEELNKKDPIVTTRTGWEEKHPRDKNLDKFKWKDLDE